MKIPTKPSLVAAMTLLLAVMTFGAQPPKGPVGKVYIAEVVGDSQVVTGGRVYPSKQGSAYNAPGSIIETGKEARQSVVYSNGSAMSLDQNTRVEIGRFSQEPFRSDRDHATLDTEPSTSQTEIFLVQGLVGICAGSQMSGTTTTYNTPHASVNVRGRRLVIETSHNQTVVAALEGDVTIRTSGADPGGQVLHAGERAVISPAGAGQPAAVRIAPMDQEALAAAENYAMLACSARKTVSFETVDSANEGAEIEAHATVPVAPPTNITVSPDRIEPGK